MAKKESKSTIVGRDYPTDRLVVPWNAGIDSGRFGSHSGKTITSPAESTFDPPFEIHHGYDKLWHGK
jgi:hypothetical protein